MSSFAEEIFQQPHSLHQLVEFYRQEGGALLAAIPAPQELILTGMGASYHAASGMSYSLQGLGLKAVVMEAIDLLQYGSRLLKSGPEILYVSQSGASAEVVPILSEARNERLFIAVTNDLHSPLAKNALFSLPLIVDHEETVATKTYVNSVAVLWLLARCWAGQPSRAGLEKLQQAADQLESILGQETEITGQWLEALGSLETILFIGAGPHAATARQAAQTVAEWSKIPVLGMSSGALRHGYIEVVGPQVGAVIFCPPGKTQGLMLNLAQELQGYGSIVLLVENGWAHRAGDSKVPNRIPPALSQDEFLSPILDILPVQLFTEALTREKGVKPGFRHLSKVVKRL